MNLSDLQLVKRYQDLSLVQNNSKLKYQNSIFLPNFLNYTNDFGLGGRAETFGEYPAKLISSNFIPSRSKDPMDSVGFEFC